MSRYDFRTTRLFVEVPLAAGAMVPLERDQTNYLVNVLRMKPGEPVLVFNGRHGEWRAALAQAGKKSFALGLIECARPQTPAGDLHYLFAPLRPAGLDYMVQRGVEFGASRLQRVLPRHTQSERINLARMGANAIGAAEQCGILTIPDIAEPIKLDAFIRAWVPE